MSLERVRFDACLRELVRSPRSRRESFDLVALAFGGIADRYKRRCLSCAGGAFEGRHLVAAGENVIHRGTLALIEVAVIVRDGFSRPLTNELRMLALAGPHPFNRFSLELHHCRCRERPPWRA